MTTLDMFDDSVPPKRYPEVPGRRDTDTSIAAADAIEQDAQLVQAMVLKAIKFKPRTSYQLAVDLGVHFETVQPRTSELRKKGLIVDTGFRGPSRSINRSAIVWGPA